MVRELNISLITGIIVGNLPIWQWDTRTGCVIGIFAELVSTGHAGKTCRINVIIWK